MIRLVGNEDIPNLVEWSQITPENGFNSRLSTYPLVQTFVVEDTAGPLLYVPWHPVMCIESLALRPGSTGKQYVEALLEAEQHTEDTARSLNIREIYTSSYYKPAIRTFRRHGYEPVPGTALRKLL